MPARQCTLRYRLERGSKRLNLNGFSPRPPGARRHGPLHSVTRRDGQRPVMSMMNGYVTSTEPPHGGSVFTPNVDHVVNVESDDVFAAAYQRASLSVADGMPLVWASKVLGQPLPERVAGSDLLEPTLQLAAKRGWRVFFLGAGPGVAEKAAAVARERFGTNVVVDHCLSIQGVEAVLPDGRIWKTPFAQFGHADLENGLRLVRSVQTVGHFVKWLLVGMLGIAVGAAMLVDSLQKVWMWLSKLGHG